MDKMRHTLTYELILEILGEATTNSIVETVLNAANVACTADDPARHETAVRELLTALLAVLVARRGDQDGLTNQSDLTQHQSQRLHDLVAAMGTTEKAEPQSRIILH